MEEIVITVTGKSCKKSDCRYIDKKYYLIGDVKEENSGDVFLINDRYVRLETGRIVFNHTYQEYCLKSLGAINGAIKFDGESPVFGYYDYNPLTTIEVILKNGSTINCINEDVITRYYREKRSDGRFYHISQSSSRVLNSFAKVGRGYKESLSYDSKNILGDFIARYENDYNPIIAKDVKLVSKVIGDLSFGVEFESTKGVIPNNKLQLLPLIPLRDGSIEGIEYVTIPLSREKGLQGLVDCVKELKKRTVYDTSCSLHVHIGNIPRTKEFILSLYKVISAFQDDIFSMFPLYKKYNFGVKRKNYSKPFPFNQINGLMEPSIDINNQDSLNRNFEPLFTYLSGGNSFVLYNNNLDAVQVHPQDPNGNQKWNIGNRYCAVNFIPLIFGNKKTVEFRIHTPTYDINKIMSFLMLNSILVNFAIKNTQRILKDPYFLFKRSLSSIMQEYIINSDIAKQDKSGLMEELDNYIYSRKKFFEEKNSMGIIAPNEDDLKIFSRFDYNNLVPKLKLGSFRIPQWIQDHEEVKQVLKKVQPVKKTITSDGFGTIQFSSASPYSFSSGTGQINSSSIGQPFQITQIDEPVREAQELLSEKLLDKLLEDNGDNDNSPVF